MTSRPRPTVSDHRYAASERFVEDPSTTFSIWTVLAILWEAKWLIVVGTISSLVVALLVSLSLPKTYRTVATVFITPPTFSSGLKPEPFSIEAYERLASSDYMRNQVALDLQKRGVLATGESLGNVSTQLYSSREPQKPYLPLIGLIAESSSPEKAQQIANAWAERFVLEQSRLAILGKAGAVDFILAEHPKASSRLGEQEQKLRSVQQRHDRETAAANTRLALRMKRAELESIERTVVDFEWDLYKTRVNIKEEAERLAQTQKEVAATASTLNLSRSVSEDALWAILAQRGQSSAGAIKGGDALKMQSQEVNPVYVHLAQQLAEYRVQHNALLMREETLVRQLATARADAARLRNAYYAGEAELTQLERQQSGEVTSIKRLVDEAQARFKKLDERIGDAQIAKAQQESDVKIGALAELPRVHSSPNIPLNVAIATMLGFLASLLGAAVLVHVRRAALERSPIEEPSLAGRLP